MPYVHVDFSLDDFEDQELIDELEDRGWIVSDKKGQHPTLFSSEELDYLAQVFINEKIGTGRAIYEKAKKNG